MMRRADLWGSRSWAAVLAPAVALAAMLATAPPASAEQTAIDIAAADDADRPDVDGYSTADITPDFTLLDTSGVERTMTSFGDDWKLVFFGYTNCLRQCPIALSSMSEATRQLEGELALSPIFIDIDMGPSRLPILATFLGDFFPGVIGLTGDRRQIQEAARNFKARRSRRRPEAGEVGKQYHHTGRLYLISPQNEVLAFLNEDATAVDILRVLRQAASGRPSR